METIYALADVIKVTVVVVAVAGVLYAVWPLIRERVFVRLFPQEASFISRIIADNEKAADAEEKIRNMAERAQERARRLLAKRGR